MVICTVCILGIMFGGNKEIEINETGASDLVFGGLIALIAAWFMAACYVVTRYLKEIHWIVVLFYHNLVGLIVAVVSVAIYSLITH